MLDFPTFDNLGGAKRKVGHTAVIDRDAWEFLVSRDLEGVVLDCD